jgi:hypothetical protein
VIETTKITIENIDGEKLELTIEEAKSLQKELNDMFGVEKEIEYRPINIPSIPTSPYVPWGQPYEPYPYSPWSTPNQPYITYYSIITSESSEAHGLNMKSSE